MNDRTSAVVIDQASLNATIRKQGEYFARCLSDRHEHLFACVPVFISSAQLVQMQSVISAVENVAKMPNWSEKAYSQISAKGVFFGYDFHLNDSGAHLIEINTNAGGAFLNALLLHSQMNTALPGVSTSVSDLEQSFVGMFRKEWGLEHVDKPLTSIAIVDETPAEQFLYPEFIIAQKLFEQAGIRAVVADPDDLDMRPDGVYLDKLKIDLIYNRLTDFSLEDYPAMSESCRKNQVVLTPNPQAYSRYADKRNLVKLTDPAFLNSLGVDRKSVEVLQTGIPQTCVVNANEAERWWGERKQWFFKPVTGYGSKGAYRGDKITKRVFEEILAGDYVAQRLAMPSELSVVLNGNISVLRYDVRCYVYDGTIQLIAARLYQGQTTNFRTSGGGFAIVRVV